MYPNEGNGSDAGQYAHYADADLLKLYESSTYGSPQFYGLMQELKRRGYTFETPPEPVPVPSPVRDPQVSSSSPDFQPHYKAGGSVAWQIVTSLLGIGVYVAFLLLAEEMPGVGGTRTYIILGLLCLMLISLGFLVAGMRHLANLRRGAKLQTHGGNSAYILFSFLWFLLSLGGVGLAIYQFLKIVDWSVEMALVAAVPTLVLSIIPMAIFACFSILGRELAP